MIGDPFPILHRWWQYAMLTYVRSWVLVFEKIIGALKYILLEIGGKKNNLDPQKMVIYNYLNFTILYRSVKVIDDPITFISKFICWKKDRSSGKDRDLIVDLIVPNSAEILKCQPTPLPPAATLHPLISVGTNFCLNMMLK